jgi:hypothetical protein
MNQLFDIQRVKWYVRQRLTENGKFYITGIAGYMAFVLLVTFFIAFNIRNGGSGDLSNFHSGSYIFFLFFGLILFTGRAFHDMNTSARSINQLMIPVSGFEKFIVPLLSTSVIWFLSATVVYQVFVFIANGLWGLIFGIDFDFAFLWELPGDMNLLLLLEIMIFIHSIVFIGSATFKKYPIAKTALSLFIINTAFNVTGLLTIIILFGNFENFGLSVEQFGHYLIDQGYDEQFIENLLRHYIKNLVVYFVPVVLYVAAYFKVKEREV